MMSFAIFATTVFVVVVVVFVAVVVVVVVVLDGSSHLYQMVRPSVPLRKNLRKRLFKPGLTLCPCTDP